MKKFSVAQLDELDGLPCPCGEARRAFTELSDAPASMHLVTINSDSKLHYHKHTSEMYLILEGEGHMEVDDDVIPLRPMTAVLIRPGCRHRAVGKLRIVNVPIPAFNPEDEWFD
ncbi:MAG: cupin domain-containing protein [Pirellulales bacterium]